MNLEDKVMHPYLPQNDPDPITRKSQLDSYRRLYVFNYNYVPPVPMLDTVPKQDYFSPRYTAGRLFSMAKLVPNMIVAQAKAAPLPLPLSRN